MANETEHPLILFDGDCNLCNRSVQFVIKRDRQARYRFASLQSEAGKAALLAARNTPKGSDVPKGSDGMVTLPDSIVLVQHGKVRVKSSAALAIARGIRWPWPLLAVFWLVPYPLRDLVYDWVARNRLRWFGKREECWIPTPELRARFLDASERK